VGEIYAQHPHVDFYTHSDHHDRLIIYEKPFSYTCFGHVELFVYDGTDSCQKLDRICKLVGVGFIYLLFIQ
jgi:hypothetical protein